MYISHSHFFGFFFFGSLLASYNVRFTKKAFAKSIDLKTMTFLFFEVARDVGDTNEKDCLFNNKSTALWSL